MWKYYLIMTILTVSNFVWIFAVANIYHKYTRSQADSSFWECQYKDIIKHPSFNKVNNG